MEKVIAHLEAQPEIENDNVKQFQEEVGKYDSAHQDKNIWQQMSEYIDQANGDNDKFLVLLEEVSKINSLP
jgi:regulator of protease activity HflC (stomatin/prohibitin superfamily)